MIKYLSNKMPVFSYSALARGFLSGKVKSKDDAERVNGVFDKRFIKEYFHPQISKKIELRSLY